MQEYKRVLGVTLGATRPPGTRHSEMKEHRSCPPAGRSCQVLKDILHQDGSWVTVSQAASCLVIAHESPSSRNVSQSV